MTPPSISTLDRRRLATVQVVPPTPFSADGKRVVVEKLAALVAELHAAGVSVFLPAAGTGEFHSLTVDEVVACVRTVRETVGNRAIVLAPLGLSLGHALAIGKRAFEAGADGLLVMPPIHSYLSDSGFRDYFQALADELPLPLLAYKKGSVPTDRLLGELGAEGRLVGVKYAVNDLDAFARFAAAHHERLGLYCGTAERWAPFFMLGGAEGFTSGAANVCPRLSLAMHRALADGNFAEAMRLLAILRPIEDFRARDGDSYNITLLKYALEVRGHDFGPPRPPMRRLTANEQAEIRKLLEPILAAEESMADK